MLRYYTFSFPCVQAPQDNIKRLIRNIIPQPKDRLPWALFHVSSLKRITPVASRFAFRGWGRTSTICRLNSSVPTYNKVYVPIVTPLVFSLIYFLRCSRVCLEGGIGMGWCWMSWHFLKQMKTRLFSIVLVWNTLRPHNTQWSLGRIIGI